MNAQPQFPQMEEEARREAQEATANLVTRIGKTTVGHRNMKEILTKASGFISTYDFSINPYQGCQFRCQYCYASTMASTREQRETWGYWVRVKHNAVEKLLEGRRLDGKSVYMSTVTDPYQPVERQVELTQRILEALADRRDRVRLVIQTRSPLVTRDLEVMQRIVANGGRVQVNMTVTTDDDEVRRLLEPGCPSTPARLKAITQAGQAEGINTAVTLTPLLHVADCQAFAQSLRRTGADYFIAQELHSLERGPHEFKATTWTTALEPMAELLGCPVDEVMLQHNRQYRKNIAELKKLLPRVVEGRQGFKPPF